MSSNTASQVLYGSNITLSCRLTQHERCNKIAIFHNGSDIKSIHGTEISTDISVLDYGRLVFTCKLLCDYTKKLICGIDIESGSKETLVRYLLFLRILPWLASALGPWGHLQKLKMGELLPKGHQGMGRFNSLILKYCRLKGGYLDQATWYPKGSAYTEYHIWEDVCDKIVFVSLSFLWGQFGHMHHCPCVFVYCPSPHQTNWINVAQTFGVEGKDPQEVLYGRVHNSMGLGKSPI